MTESLEWSDLQFFLAVCERGSIGAAAQTLRVNHSTVLRRVASLERTLQVRLFDRLPTGYALTSHGQELAANLAGVSEQLDAAQRRVTGVDAGLGGTIRLTAPDTLVQGLLLPHLAGFRARHPQLRLELVVNNGFLNLSRREADVALRGSNRPPENLVGRRVGILETALYASDAYLTSLGGKDDPADYRWVGHDDALAHLASAEWLREHVMADRIAVRVDSLVTLADVVAAGLGVGWLPCPLGEARGLRRLREPPPEFHTQLWLLTHPDLRRVARVRALTDYLQEALLGDARLLHA